MPNDAALKEGTYSLWMNVKSKPFVEDNDDQITENAHHKQNLKSWIQTIMWQASKQVPQM